MYYNSNEGLKPLVVSDTILDEALDVIGGEFTCCRLGHPNEEPCDREQLMLPLPRTVNGTGHTGPSRFCATSP